MILPETYCSPCIVISDYGDSLCSYLHGLIAEIESVGQIHLPAEKHEYPALIQILGLTNYLIKSLPHLGLLITPFRY